MPSFSREQIKEGTKAGLIDRVNHLAKSFIGRDTVVDPQLMAKNMATYYFNIVALLIDIGLILSPPCFSLLSESDSCSMFCFVWERKGWNIKVEVLEKNSIAVIAVLKTGVDNYSLERIRKAGNKKQACDAIIKSLQIMDMICDSTPG